MKKRLLSTLLVLCLFVGLVPAAAAAAPDLTYSVAYGETLKLKVAKFVDLLDEETGDDDLGYVEITDISSDFDDYGYFTATDINGKTVTLDSTTEFETYYYYDEDAYDNLGGRSDEFLLDGLTFHALDDTDSGVITVDFTLWNYDEDEYYDGYLEITVVSEEDEVFDDDNFDLVYTLDIDDEVDIRRTELRDLFEDETDETLYMMEITDVSSFFSDYGWFEAYYDDDSTKLGTASKLKKPDFYYSLDDLKSAGDPEVDFEMSGLTFVSDEDADPGWFKVKFTLWDKTKQESYEGAMAIVVGKVSISTQPKNVTADNGAPASFSVRAEGSGLAYQWQYKAPGSTEWKNSTASSGKKATLTVTAAAKYDGYQYRCKVTDAVGNSVTSNAATLTVNAPLSITSQPKNATVAPDTTATFTVKATGTGLTYQWQYKTPGGRWYNTSFTGNKTATLTVTAKSDMDGYRYRCKITSANGETATSSAAGLSVHKPLAITSQPSSKTRVVDQTVSFTVKASGEDLTYQWQYKAPGGTWKNSSATTAKKATLSFTAKNYLDGYRYRCKVTDACGDVVYSSAAFLTVGEELEITTQPYVSYDTANSKIKIRISADGESVTYQWQYKTSTGWANTTRTGAKTSALDVTTCTKSYTFRCKVTDIAGNTLTSDSVTFTVEK